MPPLLQLKSSFSSWEIAEQLFRLVAGARFAFLILLGGFALLGWLSRGLAAKADDVGTQYVGLGLYVVGEAIIFAPLLYMAVAFSDASVLPTAAILTLFMFGGLTAVAFTTRKDFTFFRRNSKNWWDGCAGLDCL